MAEITDTSLVDRIKSYLGLRGKAIVTSRNSVYPTVIVNGDQQQIAILPPTIPTRDDCRTINGITSFVNGNVTAYTVPTGKKGYLIYGYASINAAVASTVQVKNSSGTLQFYLAYSAAVAQLFTNVTTPLPLNAGDYIELNGGGAGVNGSYTWIVWETQA